jgi:hypothetical protein
MLKKTVKYTDYDGEERIEDIYFNLNKAEILEMEMREKTGLEKLIKRIIAERDNEKLVDLFKIIVLKAYGQKSLDGKRFIKSKELSDEFEQSEAYVEVFLSLALDEEAAIAFFNGIIPTAGSLDKYIPKKPKSLDTE